MIRGIDVSHWQGIVNWPAMKAQHKLSFGACKATEGLTFVDSQFARNWVNIKAAGLVRIAYHFGHPGSDPEDQVAKFLSVVRPVRGDVLCLDLEASDGRSQSQVNAWAKAFGNELRRRAPGCTTVVYLGGYSQNGSGLGLSAYFNYWWYPRYTGVKSWPRSIISVSGNTTGWALPHIWQWSDANAIGVDANISSLSAAQLSLSPVPAPTPSGGWTSTHHVEDSIVPELVKESWSGKLTLQNGVWRTLLVQPDDSSAGFPSIIAGPATVHGDCSVYVQGMEYGTSLQLRPYLVKPDGKGGWVQASVWQLYETACTDGSTFAHCPLIGYVPNGYRLRVMAAVTGIDAADVVTTHANFMYWKG